MGNMFTDLRDHPGLLFVAATLLPLLSFVLLLLAGGLARHFARPGNPAPAPRSTSYSAATGRSGPARTLRPGPSAWRSFSA